VRICRASQSNLPFLVFGVLGLVIVTPHLVALLATNGLLPAIDSTRLFLDNTEQNAWLVFFWGSTLTAFGSAYYHWRPDNARLVWHCVCIVFCEALSLSVQSRHSLVFTVFAFVGYPQCLSRCGIVCR
jgi:hypothetical protein